MYDTRRQPSPLLYLIVAAGALATACGPGAKGGGAAGPGAGKESAAALTYPVLQRVPAAATYVLTFARLDEGVQMIRDFIQPLGRVEGDADPAAIDGMLRREMGFSLLSAADLADLGLAVDKGIVVYSTALTPTLLVSVRDPAKLNEKITTLTREARLVVTEHRGVTLNVVKEREEFFAWALVGEHLAVHFGIQALEPSTTAWLNELLDAPAAPLSRAADLDWAWQQADAQGGALGLIRLPAIFAELRELDDASARTPACDQLNALLAGGVGRVALSAAFGPGKVAGRGFFELAPLVATMLAAHTADNPDGGFAALRGQAGLALSLGLDLDWIGQVMGPLGNRECGEVPRLIRNMDLDEVADPLRLAMGKKAFSSYHVALLGGSAGFGGIDLQAVGLMHVSDEQAARALLGQLGSTQAATVDGVAVQRASVPGLSPPIDWAIGGGVLRVAVGKGLVGKLFAAAAAAQGSGRELGSVAVRPDKLPDLLAALQMLGGRDGEVVARLFGEYKFAEIAFTAETSGVRVTGGFELR